MSVVIGIQQEQGRLPDIRYCADQRCSENKYPKEGGWRIVYHTVTADDLLDVNHMNVNHVNIDPGGRQRVMQDGFVGNHRR